MNLTFTFNTAAFIAALNRLPAVLDCRREPMHTAMGEASSQLMRFEHRHFTEASSGGGFWRDIKPATKAARLRRQLRGQGRSRPRGGQSLASIAAGAQMPILNETGTLERGLFEQGGPGHFRKFDADSVVEGVSGGSHPRFAGGVGKLAVIHQYGGGRVPARPEYVQPTATDLAPIAMELNKGFAAAIASLGTAGGGGAASAAVA